MINPGVPVQWCEAGDECGEGRECMYKHPMWQHLTGSRHHLRAQGLQHISVAIAKNFVKKSQKAKN